MKSGQVVESGSHDELLTLGGLYSQSWRAQIQSASQLSDLQAARA
jgi:ATP-binding cassette subfamily B protein